MAAGHEVVPCHIAELGAEDAVFVRDFEAAVMRAVEFRDVEEAMQLSLDSPDQRRFHWQRWLRLATARSGQVAESTRRLAVHAMQKVLDMVSYT